MKLTFIGAAHEVTGSCHYLECEDVKILVDYGMEQGQKVYENAPLPVSFAEIDFVLLTHAHIDHAGLLPFLYANGFRGKIITTVATGDLCRIMLRDSAHIQEMEAEWRNRKAKRAGKPEVLPLYTLNDANGVLELFDCYEYDEMVLLTDHVTVRFTDAGHLLGSASVEVWCNEAGNSRKIVFSGDIGNKNKPLIRDPQYITEADYVIMECTYGDRNHQKDKEHLDALAQIIQETLDRRGNVVIPAFAVGRTQELLYYLRKIKKEEMVVGHDGYEVYVDSPLAVEATQVFSRNLVRCYDAETKALVEQGINPISFPGLKLAVTSAESQNINFDPRPKVIISASGMCDAGRIRHHLKHNLWRKECSIVFAGYQALGTLGRSLVDGSKSVRLFGETIDVEAQMRQLEGISGHADQSGLITWIKAFEKPVKRVFAVHGDDQVCDRFVKTLETDCGLVAAAPFSGSVYDLIADCWLVESAGVPAQKEEMAAKKVQGVFARLISAGERLQQVILHNQGGANKDLAKFADQIHALCDKWE